MKKISNMTCFVLGVIFGGLVVITTDYPVYKERLSKAELLCNNTEYVTATVDLVGNIHKITCENGNVFIINKQNESKPEQRDKENSK